MEVSELSSVKNENGATEAVAFEGFGPKEWIEYYESLNKEIPVEKCRLKMSESEKEKYTKALGVLMNERKKIPGVKYEVNYKDFE